MTPATVECIYCGDVSSEWDHLRPTVMNKRPTGYITEIGNLVPACGKCNQSKGNRAWREWMLGAAARSPTSRGVGDLESRVACLETYERRWDVRPIDVEAVIPRDEWDRYWAKREALVELAVESQRLAKDLAAIVAQAHQAGGRI